MRCDEIEKGKKCDKIHKPLSVKRRIAPDVRFTLAISLSTNSPRTHTVADGAMCVRGNRRRAKLARESTTRMREREEGMCGDKWPEHAGDGRETETAEAKRPKGAKRVEPEPRTLSPLAHQFSGNGDYQFDSTSPRIPLRLTSASTPRRG